MRRLTLFTVAVLLVNTMLFSSPGSVEAGALTSLSDVVTRHKVSEFSNHTFNITTPSGVATGENITITFPAGFSLSGLSYLDVDVSWGPTTGSETSLTLAGTATGTTWGVNVVGQAIIISSAIGTINANSKIIIKVGTNAVVGSTGTVQIQNPGSSTIALVTIGGSFADSGKVAIAILTDDQVPVTALVDPYLTFSLSSLTTNFGSMSATSVTTSTPNITLTIATNAAHGYTVTLRDTGDGINSGLYNSVIGYLIGSADSSFSNSATLTGGTEGYGVQATSSNATIASPYNGSGTTVGALKQTLTSLASFSTLPANSHTIVVTHKAAIAITSAAGQYVDHITYGVSGNF